VRDRVTVLRDGATRVAGDAQSPGSRLSLGRKPDQVSKGARRSGTAANAAGRPVLLQAEALKYQNRLGVLIEVRHGEIVGLQVCSAWSKRTARALFGAELLEGGNQNSKVAFSPRGPHDAIDAGWLSSQTARTALSLLSVRENLTLAAPPAHAMGHRFRKRQGELVDRFMQRLGIKATGAEQKIHELGRQSAEGPSGAMAVQEYETFLLDEPTCGRRWRGEIQRLIAELAEQARGSRFHRKWKSSLKAHSVVVLRDGRSVAELSGEQKNTKAICTPWRKVQIVRKPSVDSVKQQDGI